MRGFIVTQAPPEALGNAVAESVSPLTPDDNLALVGALGRYNDDEPVLVAGAAAYGDRLHTMVSMAELCYPDLRVATRVAPVATAAVLAALTIAIGSELPPALAVHQFDATIACCWSGAWMRSVANLVDPAPSVRQHLRSWLPGGAGYVAVHGPSARVVPAHALDTVEVPRPAPDRDLLVAGALAPGIGERLRTLADAGHITVIAPVTDTEDQYGVAGAVEFAAVPKRRADVVAVVGRCPSCGEHLGAESCPFCHVRAADNQGAA